VTYAADLAAGTRDLLEAAPPAGIYHVINRGSASWYDFAPVRFRAGDLSHRGEEHDSAAGPSTRFPGRRPIPNPSRARRWTDVERVAPPGARRASAPQSRVVYVLPFHFWHLRYGAPRREHLN
jgi:dTDP-4-dehydrorhamnose reductase